MRHAPTAIVVPIISLLACADARADLDSAGPFDPTTADAEAGSAEDTGGLERLDVGDGDSDGDGDPDGSGGCVGVDLLFVIDDSKSMAKYQQGLSEAFPRFIDEIFEQLPAGVDVHIGITRTSFEAGDGGGGPPEDECSSLGSTEEAISHYLRPDQGDTGVNGGQGRLYAHEGVRYLELSTDDDPAAAKAWFSGAAGGIGEAGSLWEMVSAGGAFAAHPANADTNEGFIRDTGAVLVVFVLTDEVDNSPESAASYHDMLAAAKAECGGDACIVAGGLVRECLATTPGNTLFELLSSFGKTPVIGDIHPGFPYADPDTSHYQDVLGDALAQVIAKTCESFPPQG